MIFYGMIMGCKSMKDALLLKRQFQSKDIGHPDVTKLCALQYTSLLMTSFFMTALEHVYIMSKSCAITVCEMSRLYMGFFEICWAFRKYVWNRT